MGGTNLPASGPSSLPRSGERPSAIERTCSERMTMPEAIEAVGRMIRGYPNAKPPDSYLGTIAALLCAYPRRIALDVADPIRGVARKCKFLPTVADIVAWCEKPLERIERRAEYEWRSRVQLKERMRLAAEHKAEDAEHRAGVVARIRAALAAAGMRLGGEPAGPIETAAQFRARLGISDAAWNAIPDGPKSHWQRMREAMDGKVPNAEAAE